ncbi:MAG: hypothetical protein M2R46_05439 [Verrucomicrobia subdivision 3 bacterium]|nr:hypothetical protein [Limisphaerales bacterium]
MLLNPVMNDAALAGCVIEETIHISGNQDINIHEQAITFDLYQMIHEKPKFQPGCPRMALRKFDMWQRMGFDFRKKP